MRTKKLLAVLLAVVTVICMIPFTAMAADPAIIDLDGERTVFVSNFGKMAYNGKTYASFRNVKDAFNKLGAEGGRIVFAGELALGNFDGISAHGKIHLQGVGTKATGNVLNFCGTADSPIKEVSLKGDLVLDFLTIRFEEGAVLLTNGYELETINEFDTYSKLYYVADGDDRLEYINPPSVAPGASSKDVSSVVLDSGTFNSVIVGAATAQNVKGDSFIRLNGGNYANVVAGNTTSAAIDGDAMLYVANGNIEKLVAGPSAGTVNGNVSVQIAGGEITDAVVGAEAGATVNGNVTVILSGGTFKNKVTAGAGKVTGKKIIITGTKSVAQIGAGVADYIIKVDGGICEPQFDGANVSGFLVTDTNGIPAKNITVNGKAQSAENGVYALPAGTVDVKITSVVTPAINKNSNYVAGYTDGTFKPQNNMTKAEAVTLLARTIIDENLIKEVKTTYKDAEAGAWYVPYIGFFEKLGYLDLVADASGTRFNPNENITRAQFVQMVYKIMSGNTESKSTKLVAVSDVDFNNPYKTAIYYATSNGIVAGYPDGTFKPDASITRAEVVTIVNRMLGRTPTGNAGSTVFSDTAAHWANSQILAACNPEGVA
ncbi:MAG: S-layer homology domain-containing protein, partial [Clostridia bacterium]|nr:S-layer homology domain-containing protein [Clostridia bacterium]